MAKTASNDSVQGEHKSYLEHLLSISCHQFESSSEQSMSVKELHSFMCCSQSLLDGFHKNVGCGFSFPPPLPVHLF